MNVWHTPNDNDPFCGILKQASVLAFIRIDVIDLLIRNNSGLRDLFLYIHLKICRSELIHPTMPNMFQEHQSGCSLSSVDRSHFFPHLRNGSLGNLNRLNLYEDRRGGGGGKEEDCRRASGICRYYYLLLAVCLSVLS